MVEVSASGVSCSAKCSRRAESIRLSEHPLVSDSIQHSKHFLTFGQSQCFAQDDDNESTALESKANIVTSSKPYRFSGLSLSSVRASL